MKEPTQLISLHLLNILVLMLELIGQPTLVRVACNREGEGLAQVLQRSSEISGQTGREPENGVEG